jgi:hypothetical protein
VQPLLPNTADYFGCRQIGQAEIEQGDSRLKPSNFCQRCGCCADLGHHPKSRDGVAQRRKSFAYEGQFIGKQYVDGARLERL